MTATPTQTVGDIALQLPHATRVFEKFRIDYCCGGGRTLEAACAAIPLDIKIVLESLNAAAAEPSASVPTPNFASFLLSDLIDYILRVHHEFLRSEIVRLSALLDKVCSVHSARHPELLEIRRHFRLLSEELILHLLKEEKVLFPYVARLEEAFLQQEPPLPAPFGTVENPVRMMVREHESAGSALLAIRAASSGFALPDDACFSYRILYRSLEAFEADMHQHIHLENNILFPRAIALEDGMGRPGKLAPEDAPFCCGHEKG